MQGRYENKNRETAVSEVLGAVMLIAVVVTAIAVIGVALTSQSQPEKIPALDAIISSNGKDTIRIFHNGGDSLTSQEVAILVDGVDRTSSFTIQGSGWTTWSPGQSLDDNYGSLPGKVQLIYKSPTTQTVLVSADFAGGMPTYVPTVLPTPGVPATVMGITPAIGITGSSLPATISGSGFQTAATVSLVRGSAVIPAAGVMVVSQNQITCTFNLNGAATGSWNVNVTNPASTSSTLTNGFTVIPQGPAPAVTRINPVSGNSGTSVSIGNLTGTGFVSGASVRLSRSGSSDLFAQNVNVLDANNLTCTFVLPGGTASGAWDVTVRNTDGQSGTLPNGFTVTNPGPTVTGITPGAAYTGTMVTISNLSGTGFMNGATVNLNSTSDPTGISASSVVVISQNQISCTFDLTGASLGARNIVVTNSDGKTGILPNGFTVSGTGPLVTAINPVSGIVSTTYSPVSIGGSGFLTGATVNLTRTGSPDISATSVNVGSPNFITCTIPLPAGAALGPWNVTVTNPDGKNGTLTNGFRVLAPVPTITSISPGSGTVTGGTSVTIIGTSLTTTTNVTFGGTAAASFTVTDDTHIIATSPALTAGVVDVRVTTLSGISAVTSGDQFTYIALPTVTSLSPTSGAAAGGTTVTITGTALAGATNVMFGGTAGTILTNTATQITARSPDRATGGTVDVTVTTVGGTSAIVAGDRFTYTGVAPAVTGLSPASGVSSGGTTVTITGSGFTSASTVSFGGTAGTGVTFVSDTQITVISPTRAAGGTVDVRVTTVGGTSAIVAGDRFTYTGVAPAVTSLSPTSGVAGGGTTVTITGTGFTSASTVSFGGTAGTSVTFVSATSITVTSPARAAGGTVDVRVTTVGGTSAIVAGDRFAYTGVAPAVTGLSPTSGVAGGGTTVTITGTGFTSASTVSFGGTAGTSVTFVSDTQITVRSPARVTGGTVDVRVTTVGGTSAIVVGDRFTYTGVAPAVTSLSPASGTRLGGTTVTITGTGFTDAATISFGGTAGTGVTFVSATSISVISPAHAAGVVDVRVTTVGGTSAIVAADRFTYT